MQDSVGDPSGNAEPRKEEDLLEREDRLAMRALRASLRGIGEDVSHALDLERHADRDPWGTLLASATGGFLLARPVTRLMRRPGAVGTLVKPLASASAQIASVGLMKEIARSWFSDDDR